MFSELLDFKDYIICIAISLVVFIVILKVANDGLVAFFFLIVSLVVSFWLCELVIKFNLGVKAKRIDYMIQYSEDYNLKKF